MAGSPSVIWQILGTILCGLVFTIPVIIGYYIVSAIMGRIEKRKERLKKETTVI